MNEEKPEAVITPAPEPVDTTGNVLQVHHCGSCDGIHENVPVHPYAKTTPPYTHWFICPTTRDPVPLTLVMMDGKRGIEINNAIIHALVQAQKTNAYMVVIYRVEDGLVKLSRTTQNFPTGDFDNSVKALKQDLDKEMGVPAEMPMREAPKPTPMVNLFGQ